MKNNGWMNMLFAMVFIAIPFLFILFYVFEITSFKEETKYMMLTSGGFAIYGVGISFAVVFLKVLHVDSLKFNIPISLVFTVLLFTYEAELYYLIPLSIIAMLSAIPANIFVTKYKESKIRK